MDISVVIPTCNRKERLLSLLGNLNDGSYAIKEVIVVDSGKDRLTTEECCTFQHLDIIYLNAEKSVCIQRNKGIVIAKSPWIFVCDDDIEVPADYLEKIIGHIIDHPDVVAVSGLVLQQEKNNWVAKYPITSIKELLWKYIFKLSIWGEVACRDTYLSRKLKRYYLAKGNHISKAGWPIITDYGGAYFITPVYGLGASVINKEWLTRYPYDEILDSHGIGDNYGLSINFPKNSIHVLNNAFVYHHQEMGNRLERSTGYYRRIMALDYFRKTNKNIGFVKKGWLLWSLMGNLLSFTFKRNNSMAKATLKLIWLIILNRNPYYLPQ